MRSFRTFHPRRKAQSKTCLNGPFTGRCIPQPVTGTLTFTVGAARGFYDRDLHWRNA